MEKGCFSGKIWSTKNKSKGETPLQLSLNVSEAVELFKAFQKSPGSILELVRMNVQEEVGKYLSNLMGTELSHLPALCDGNCLRLYPFVLDGYQCPHLGFIEQTTYWPKDLPGRGKQGQSRIDRRYRKVERP